MKKKVTRILKELSFEPHLKGYGYIREAIMMCLEDTTLLDRITKGLYPSVAEKNETTTSKVERAIRHAIGKAVEKADVSAWSKYISGSMEVRIYVPNNREFIAAIVDYIEVFEE